MSEKERPPEVQLLSDARAERHREIMAELLEQCEAMFTTIDRMGGLAARDSRMHRLMGEGYLQLGALQKLVLQVAGISDLEWEQYVEKHKTPPT